MKRSVFKEQSQLTVPNDLSYLPAIQAYVTEIGRKIGFEEEELNQIDLGLEEAVTNVIKHAFEPCEKAAFHIICQPMAAGLRIIIKDRGVPFDPSQTPQYHPDRISLDSSSKGLGTFLIRETMDEYSFRYLGKRGKEVHLIKYLKKGHIENYLPDRDLVKPEEPVAEEDRERIPIAIRWMEPDEAMDVCKLVYQGYGYSYLHDHLYYPDRLIKLHAQGRVNSAIAVTPGRDIVGHMALIKEEEGSRIAEAGMGVVSRKFRRQAIAEKLLDFVIREAGKKRLTGVYGNAVTNHPYMQRISEKAGLKTCGLMLGYAPSTMSFKGITEHLSSRESTVTVYRSFKKIANQITFPPPQHLEMIDRLYRNIGAHPRIQKPRTVRLKEEHSQVEMNINRDFKTSEIVLSSYGKHVLSEIETRLIEIIGKGIKVIHLFLNLRDPLTSSMTGKFEKLGFFFGGILPGAHFEDALVLQYLNHLEIHYDKIELHADVSKELLNHIRNRINP
jgi:anti-sigma regulatory factor (Ser/Thr protein kinase)